MNEQLFMYFATSALCHQPLCGRILFSYPYVKVALIISIQITFDLNVLVLIMLKIYPIPILTFIHQRNSMYFLLVFEKMYYTLKVYINSLLFLKYSLCEQLSHDI